jgi:7-cyano-7-deazaguanine synthase in queuosine biosynthesis
MKKAMTISGGFDSACLPFLIPPVSYDFIFFDYGQSYLIQELKYAKKLATHFNKKLIIIHLFNSEHNQERRNFIFLSKLKELKYSEVVLGNRGIFPLFDKYKDSNWLSLKLFSWLLGMKIKLPITAWTKKRIFTFLLHHDWLIGYNCYVNKINWQTCSCPNCKERQKITRWL